MTQKFEFEDFVILPNFRLVDTDVITPEQRETQGGAPELKIQLFFESIKYDKNTRQTVPVEMCRFLGAYTRVKISESNLEKLYDIGFGLGSIVTMRCVPNPWVVKIWDETTKKVKEERLGIWFQFESVSKIDGRDVNFQIIQPKTSKPKTDAFAHLKAKRGGATEVIEREFNSELEQYMEA